MSTRLVQKALWLIESRIDDEIDLAALAGELGVSPFHLCRAFVAALGQPPMRYLRRRRLSRAVSLLTARDASILEVALASGYASHASFTRRFSTAFGTTPGGVRDGSLPSKADLQEPITMPSQLNDTPRAIRYETRPAFAVAGLAARYTLDTNSAIPGQWAAFVPRISEIVGRVGETSYGVCFGSADDGSFAYLTAVEVDPGASLPRDFKRLRIAAARYAVFEHRGSAATLRDTVMSVWERGLGASGLHPAGAPDFEVYPEDYDPMDEEARVEIWVPLSEAGDGR